MDELRILKYEENSAGGELLHVRKVALGEGILDICVSSDLAKLDIYINGVLAMRQKSSGIFDFVLPRPAQGRLQVRISPAKQTNIFHELTFDI